MGYTLEEAEVEDVREKIKFNNMKQVYLSGFSGMFELMRY